MPSSSKCLPRTSRPPLAFFALTIVGFLCLQSEALKVVKWSAKVMSSFPPPTPTPSRPFVRT